MYFFATHTIFNPVLSVRQASDGLGIPFRTAQAYLSKFVQAGVLREITGYARNRIFQADEILRAVQDNDFHFGSGLPSRHK